MKKYTFRNDQGIISNSSSDIAVSTPKSLVNEFHLLTLMIPLNQSVFSQYEQVTCKITEHYTQKDKGNVVGSKVKPFSVSLIISLK